MLLPAQSMPTTRLGFEGAKVLAFAMGTLTNIVTLNLVRMSEVPDDTCVRVTDRERERERERNSRALAPRSLSTASGQDGNHIGASGAKVLVEALAKLTGMTKLHIVRPSLRQSHLCSFA